MCISPQKRRFVDIPCIHPVSNDPLFDCLPCRCNSNPMSHEKNRHEPRKKPSYFPLYWLVNRDPYNGLLQSLYNWVVKSPIYPKQPGFFSLPTRRSLRSQAEIKSSAPKGSAPSWKPSRFPKEGKRRFGILPETLRPGT